MLGAGLAASPRALDPPPVRPSIHFIPYATTRCRCTGSCARSAPGRPQATSRRKRSQCSATFLLDHVSVEERRLFEEIERIVPAAELEGLRL